MLKNIKPIIRVLTRMAGNISENIWRIVTSNSTKTKVRFIIIKRKIQVSSIKTNKLHGIRLRLHVRNTTMTHFFALAVWFLVLGVSKQRKCSTNLAHRPTQRTKGFELHSHRFLFWETFRLQVICKNIAFDTSYIGYKTATSMLKWVL